ncbi:uncharacterized protein PHALS_02662 [Plasmopara halstedii]|uniref:Uncharacterized protein n=1 Tax=Plasmopara halstedii TaxID=4781 RepID=A0A0N7L770_PLAHL|nr:uncharacterized protein PHALS_02662 [Plasmopara halstedii]CEG46251.1 hypothetical protein PHALS_02662 [Plasmopara halstedii]|eukprot:XP_024582620.1 hypothetical protein PHALS_02662 [Plasmopara halstedii]
MKFRKTAVNYKRGLPKNPAINVNNADSSDEQEVNVEVSNVHTSFLPLVSPDNLQNKLLGSAQDQWLGSLYDLKDLMKIRTHADGLRRVNLANRFFEVSSSESSNSEGEMKSSLEISDDDLTCIFFRHDRILFQVKRLWIRGTVRRRILKSNFYSIRADNGTLFDAVPASKMELLEEEVVPINRFSKGDRVFWIPDANEDTARTRRQTNNQEEIQLTYKAKIIRVHASNRYDLLLRTNRLVKKVSYKQLRPCAES